MPRDKDLKRLVRTRMRKTGEAYTAARAQIINKGRPGTDIRAVTLRPPATVPTPKDYPVLAGMSDEKIREKTGCPWERWVRSLDRLGADKMSHRDIAALVRTKYKVDPWWTQSVTVGYERIKGLRVRGQKRDGSFGATKSRTFDVPVTTLFQAWANAGARKRWLNGTVVTVRTATAPTSMRLGWPDGSIVAVGFTAKGTSKSVVALEHSKVSDRESANRLKEFWSERLDALGEVLAE